MASNKRRRYTPDQIIRKLAEGNKATRVRPGVGRGVPASGDRGSTWHRWLAQYGGMKANDAKRLKELDEAENARLKKSWSPIRPSTPTCSRRSVRVTSDPEPLSVPVEK